MDEIIRIWLSGGWVMVPLFALAVLLYAQAFGLMLYVRRNALSAEGEAQMWNWVASPEKAEGQIRGILEYTQASAGSADQIRQRFHEVRINLLELIDRRTRFVGTLVAAAPLTGLLGTVIGMLSTFAGISMSGGAETAGVTAAGISEALVTTQTGLTIALPALFVVMVIRRRRDALDAQLARLESLTLNHFNFASADATPFAVDSPAREAEETRDAPQPSVRRGRTGRGDQPVAHDRLHLHSPDLFHRDHGLRRRKRVAS